MGMTSTPNPPTLILPDDPGESAIERMDRKIERFLVVVFTVIGGILRFALLDRPTLGMQEASLYSAVSGSFHSLLETIHTTHASALFLITYWGIGHALPLNPWIMRLLPALAGTLMIPSIYFLARQIVSPRAAILAAALTACSAYLLGWSREAQVETSVWFFVVWNFAALLHWLRTRKTVGYFAWLTTGIIMLALDPAGVTALALEVLVFATFFPQRSGDASNERSRARQAAGLIALAVLFFGGLAIITTPQLYARLSQAAPPAPAQSTTAPLTHASGWRQQIAAKATGADLSLASFSTLLMGWQYPRPDQRGGIDSRMFWYLSLALEILSILLALALVPWRREKLAPVRPRRPMEIVELPKIPGRRRELPNFERFAQPSWRMFLWLFVWLLVPAYVFYCAASADAGSPYDLNAAILDAIAHHWLYACIVLAVIAGSIVFWIREHHPIARQDIRRNVVPIIQLLLILAGLWALGLAIQQIAGGGSIPLELLPHNPGFLWPPFAILVAALIYRIRWHRLRHLGIFLLLAINVAFAAFFVLQNPRPRIDLMAQDVLAANAPRSAIRTFVYPTTQNDDRTGTLFNVVGEYYLAVESGLTPYQPSPDGHGIPRFRWKINRIVNEAHGSRPHISRQPRRPPDPLGWCRRSDPHTQRLHPGWRAMGAQRTKHLPHLRPLDVAASLCPAPPCL